MKKTLITLSLLIGLILATQAQLNIGLPQTLTYDNAPDSIKASLFSTNGTAMPFDSLYITVGTPWTETVNFYHSSRGADINTGLNASYVFTSTPTTANSVGKRPKADGTRGPKCDFSDLNTFETTEDGFLRDNKRTETTTLYYGWHVIKRIRNYSYTVTISSSIKRTGVFTKKYTYTPGTKKDYKDEYTEVYNYDSTVGSTTPIDNTPPRNTNNSPSEEVWHKELDDIETWTPNVTNGNAGTLYEEKKGGLVNGTYNFTQQKISNKIITDYIYIWATKEEIESGTFTLPSTNTEIEALINRSTTNTTGYTFNVTQNATLYDIVGQVRHHFTVGTPNSATYGTCHYNYYDTTWYDLNYSYNGQRYNTSNPNASYHEYDKNYETTGEVTKIVNGESKSEYYSTIINKKPAVAMLVYAKNDNKFQYVRTANPCTQRAGRITNRKIYIHAYVDNLHWNSGDYLGWMQPVDCDIYLDNVRLSAANNEELFTVYDNKVHISGSGDANSLEDFSCIYKKASVFYLPENSGNTENISTIHLRGKNYLGGNMAGRPKINMDVMGSYSGATVYIPVRYVMSNFSAPIAIKDKKLFTSDGTPNLPFDKNKVWETNIPQITCQIDATWADGNTQSDGYLDLSTRTSTIQDVTKGPLSDGTYHMANRCDVIDGYSEMLGNRTIYPTRIWGYSYLPHLRYEAPLVTGGEHGTFVINGGQINLWPANAYTLDGYIQRSPLAYVGIEGMGTGIGNMIMRAGKSTNYMACGNTSWILSVDGSKKEIFNESSDGILTFFTNAKATCGLYGIGDGLPEGNLIINGGTISAHTDEDSYGYTTGQPNVDNATVLNANGTKQPLFGPDVQINGGTFQWPLYGAKNNPHGTGKAFYGPAGVSAFGREFKCHNEYETGNDHGQIRPPYGYNGATKDQWNKGTLHTYANYDTKGNITTRTNTYTIDWTWSILEWDENQYQAINKHDEPVSRVAYALPEENTDYTTFNDTDITDESNAHNPSAAEGKKAVMGNAGADKEYLYGMTNVWSDDKALGYFYLPEERSGIMQNYYIKSTDKLTAFTQTTHGETTSTHFPYHLWIDKGGEISVADNYIIHGRPHYRATYTEDIYQTIAMPFTAKRFFVTDPWDDQFRFYSYVEVDDANAAGVPEADRININSNAYCYLYFLDDEATNPSEDADIVHDQRATGVNNTFRSYYHTHTDGSTMQAGKTYVIKFPKVDEANYWGTNTVTLQGEKGQTILGNKNFKLATRPETTPNDTENPTFIMDGNTTFATQDISGKGEIYLVDPAQWGDDAFHATTVSTLAPMQGYLVGSTTTMQRYRIIGREGKVEQTALDQLIHTGWTAVGAHQAMLIMTPQDATAHIYTAEGKLWKTVSLTANTGVIIDTPAGFYIVHAGNDSKKVLVH